MYCSGLNIFYKVKGHTPQSSGIPVKIFAIPRRSVTSRLRVVASYCLVWVLLCGIAGVGDGRHGRGCGRGRQARRASRSRLPHALPVRGRVVVVPVELV